MTQRVCIKTKQGERLAAAIYYIRTTRHLTPTRWNWKIRSKSAGGGILLPHQTYLQYARIAEENITEDLTITQLVVKSNNAMFTTRAIVLLTLLAAPSAAFVQPTLFSPASSSSARFASKKEVTNGEATKTKKKNGKKGTNGEAAINGNAATNGEASKDDPYSFIVPILGDLHIDPRKMEDYSAGREHIKSIIRDAKAKVGNDNVALVSLGDLGESKNCDHNPDNPFELFAGTSKCHTMAAEFLGSFDVPYEVIGGNHDLEGIDEFDSDARNLRSFLKCHGKETPQFCREIAEKTLLVGLCSTIFREARYTSHEVIIDDEQIRLAHLCVYTCSSQWKWHTHHPGKSRCQRVLLAKPLR